MDQVVGWIDGHVGFVALLTAIASFLLFVEARASRMRSEAVVEAIPDLYGQGTALVVVISNSGPAVARSASLKMTLDHPIDPLETSEHRMDRRALPVGQMLLLPRVNGQIKQLQSLAEAGYTLRLRWSWKDERRLLWIGPRLSHQREEIYPTRDIFEGLRMSGLLVSPTTDLDLLLQRTVERPISALSSEVGKLTSAVLGREPKSLADRIRSIFVSLRPDGS